MSAAPTPIAHPPTNRLAAFAADIKLSHSVFAMPFALLAMFLAAADAYRHPTWIEAALIAICMVFARTVAMAVNRWADARLDVTNPRTAARAIPAGKLTTRYMRNAALLSAAAFTLATAAFWVLADNPYPLIASPLVLAWLAAYSFTKRFTWLCHLFLGSALAASPLAAALAINPQFLARPDAYLLAAMVMCWVAGFDVIYALQDVAADRRDGVYSMPAKLGESPALWISRALHLIAIAALLALTAVSPTLGRGFVVGVALVAGLVTLEQALVWRAKTKHLHMAFFTLNGAISLVLGALGIFDVLRYLG